MKNECSARAIVKVHSNGNAFSPHVLLNCFELHTAFLLAAPVPMEHAVKSTVDNRVVGILISFSVHECRMSNICFKSVVDQTLATKIEQRKIYFYNCTNQNNHAYVNNPLYSVVWHGAFNLATSQVTFLSVTMRRLQMVVSYCLANINNMLSVWYCDRKMCTLGDEKKQFSTRFREL